MRESHRDSGKLAYLKNGHGAIHQELRLPEALSRNGCQRQFKAKWLDEYQWLTYSASEDGGTMRSVSQKTWSRCWAVDHEAHDQLDKRFNI